MNRKYPFLFPLIFALIWIGCASTKHQVYSDSHTSQSSLDWTGSYKGEFPCADCDGIATVIHLNQDNTYQLFQKYEGRNAVVNKSSGTFTWDNQGRNIVLKSKSGTFRFQVGENKLFLLDADGKRINGSLKKKYILNKEENTITEKYWKLVSLNGESVKVEGTREAYIILKQDGDHFIGHGGCNAINGHYQLRHNNGIGFDEIISTEMSCKAMDAEHKLIAVLQGVSNYVLEEDTLVLRKGETPMATLEAVYLR